VIKVIDHNKKNLIALLCILLLIWHL